jgi:hypothetical protein
MGFIATGPNQRLVDGNLIEHSTESKSDPRSAEATSGDSIHDDVAVVFRGTITSSEWVQVGRAHVNSTAGLHREYIWPAHVNSTAGLPVAQCVCTKPTCNSLTTQCLC